jgi:hypothetical protein
MGSHPVWRQAALAIIRLMTSSCGALVDLVYLVTPTGAGNPQAVQVWTGNTVLFGPRPVETLDPLLLGGVVTLSCHTRQIFKLPELGQDQPHTE